MDFQHFKNAALILRAINNKKTRAIIDLLMPQHKDHLVSYSVTQLYTILGWSQSDCSQNLAVLRKHRIVIANRYGKHISYSLNMDHLNYLNGIAAAFVTFSNRSVTTAAFIQ